MEEFSPTHRRSVGPSHLQTQDAASVVDEYLRTCQEQGIFEVRIIHGKERASCAGPSMPCLKGTPWYLDFTLDSGPSGWGATLVRLRR